MKNEFLSKFYFYGKVGHLTILEGLIQLIRFIFSTIYYKNMGTYEYVGGSTVDAMYCDG